MGVLTLRVIDGADRGRVYANLQPPITIGREEGNSVQLNDERVSRFHLKIQEDQEKLVLTDLESTNGTKVNGEDIQLRILRHGDMVSLGRSVLLVGTQEEIAARLAQQRKRDVRETGAFGPAAPGEGSHLEFELAWSDDPNAQTTFQTLAPPELPERMTPGQAAQLAEVLEYLHVRIRDLLASAKPEGPTKRIALDERPWQALLDLQAQLGTYLRQIAEPRD